MLKFIENPHLPQGNVRSLIIGEKYANQLELPLKQHEITVKSLRNNTFSDIKLCGHADLSIIHLGNNKIATYDKVFTMSGADIIRLSTPASPDYPYDAGLNVCILGEYLICNPGVIETDLLKLIGQKRILKVKQGYTKCSICVVNENSIITDDAGIHKAAVNANIDSLLISKGIVALDGFNYGFIGGASFKISKSKLAFTGIIPDSRLRTEIESFLADRNIEAVYLTDNNIYDIGGAIPITEEI